MSIEKFINYEEYIKLQDRQLEIWGQPCSIYSPTNKTALGYEDTTYTAIDKIDSDKVLGNTYIRNEGRIWINFTVNKSVYYRMNWFPEENEELCMAFINSSSTLKENEYIRTAVPGATSIWGSLIFSVRKIVDVGLIQVLQRIYFLKPTNNADLHKELSF